jgi:MoxR-like ATPase
MATQNPIEQEGTYPLPEAQLDRFLLKIRLDYPAPQEEREILGRYGRSGDPHDLEKAGLKRLPEGEWISRLRKQATEVKI